MRPVSRACTGVFGVLIVPGLLVASILGLRLRALSTWAAIPALSIATIWVLAEVTMVLHVPFGVPALVVLLLVFAGALAFLRRRRSTPAPAAHAIPEPAARHPARRATSEPWLAERTAHGLLALGIAIGAATWFRGLRHVPLIPPGADATRHGWFVGRILYEHTIDLSQVLSYDVGGAHHTFTYYPLALHASAALSTRLVGSDVGRVLVAYLVVFSAVVLPLGMFVLARTIAPNRPLIAGFTALVVPVMMLFPYYPAWGGDLPMIVAMSMVPAAVVLLHKAMLARHPRIGLSRAFVVALAPSALTIMCIVALHTSELPIIAFLTLLLVVERAWRTRDYKMVPPALVRGAGVAALATVFFAPTLVSFVHGVNERTTVNNFVAENPKNWEPSLGAILQLHWGAGTIRQGFLSLLAVAGAALFLSWRRPAWAAGWVGVVMLTLFASSSPNRFVHQLTFPWYHQDHRIVVNLAFFIPFFAGVTLAYGTVLVSRAVRRPWVILPASIAMIAVLAQFVGIHAIRADSAYIRTSFDSRAKARLNQAVVGSSSLAAFRWLHEHAGRGDTVVNQPFVDGSLWMYTLERVSPLTGPYVTSAKVSTDLSDRLYLVSHVRSLGRDPRADALARRFKTHWVFYDSRKFVLGHRVFDLAELRLNPRLKVAFHQGGTWVFRIDV